jgi:ankyrin repeat protein
MNFETLKKLLSFDSLGSDEERLRKLERWCFEEISTDIRFSTGSLDEQYSSYLQLAQAYLDDFIPIRPKELHQSVPQFDNKTTLEVLVASGMDRALNSLAPSRELINAPDPFGMTLLHVAALAGNFNTVVTLLRLGADPRKPNKQMQLPIFSALVLPIDYEAEEQESKVKIYQFLKETAPDTLNQLDKNGDSVLQMMAVNDFSTLMEELLSTDKALAYKANNHSHFPVHTAILNNNLESVRIILKENDMTNAADSKKRLPIHYAARYSGEEMVALCFDASNTIDPLDIEGKTPFMLAAEVGNESTMQALMLRGANVNLTDAEGQTALHLAVNNRDINTVLWLLDKTNIDVNAKDRSHQTALSICERMGNDDLSELLISRGATPDCRLTL